MKDLDPTLRALFEESQKAWPDVPVSQVEFAQYVAERLEVGSDPSRDLQRLHAKDLYLACACAKGGRRALQRLDGLLITETRRALASMRPSPSFTEEVLQLLRQRLLVAAPGKPPRIAGYSGEGSLSHWIRVAALRTALNLRRDAKEPPRTDENLIAELPASSRGPEFQLIRSEHRQQFAEAFREALRSLPKRDRSVLRLHFLDGLNVDQLGAIYRIHRSTAARWIVHARKTLVGHIRAGLARRLSLSDSELDSFMRAFHSQLDVSLRQL